MCFFYWNFRDLVFASVILLMWDRSKNKQLLNTVVFIASVYLLPFLYTVILFRLQLSMQLSGYFSPLNPEVMLASTSSPGTV